MPWQPGIFFSAGTGATAITCPESVAALVAGLVNSPHVSIHLHIFKQPKLCHTFILTQSHWLSKCFLVRIMLQEKTVATPAPRVNLDQTASMTVIVTTVIFATFLLFHIHFHNDNIDYGSFFFTFPMAIFTIFLLFTFKLVLLAAYKLLYTSPHPETIPSHSTHPLIAYAATSVSDGIICFISLFSHFYFQKCNIHHISRCFTFTFTFSPFLCRCPLQSSGHEV